MEKKEIKQNQKILEDFDKEVKEEIKETTVEATAETPKVEATPASDEEAKLIASMETFEPKFNDKTPGEIEAEKAKRKEENGEHIEADGRILTFKKIEVCKPKMFKIDKNGVKTFIPPKEGKNSKYYEVKLKVMFEEDNIVAYYGKMNVWVNDGKLSDEIAVWREGQNKAAILLKFGLIAMAKERKVEGSETFKQEKVEQNDKMVYVITGNINEYDAFSKTIKDQEVWNWLISKKGKIKTAKDTYEGKQWFRNDVVEIVK